MKVRCGICKIIQYSTNNCTYVFDFEVQNWLNTVKRWLVALSIFHIPLLKTPDNKHSATAIKWCQVRYKGSVSETGNIARFCTALTRAQKKIKFSREIFFPEDGPFNEDIN